MLKKVVVVGWLLFAVIVLVFVYSTLPASAELSFSAPSTSSSSSISSCCTTAGNTSIPGCCGTVGQSPVSVPSCCSGGR